jgi:hypothetical protein
MDPETEKDTNAQEDYEDEEDDISKMAKNKLRPVNVLLVNLPSTTAYHVYFRKLPEVFTCQSFPIQWAT